MNWVATKYDLINFLVIITPKFIGVMHFLTADLRKRYKSFHVSLWTAPLVLYPIFYGNSVEVLFMCIFILIEDIYLCWFVIDQIEFPTTDA